MPEQAIARAGRARKKKRGADGRSYVIGGVYDTVDRPHRLSYTDGLGEPTSIWPETHTTITFEPLPNGNTLLTKTSTATPAVHQLNAAWLRAMGGG